MTVCPENAALTFKKATGLTLTDNIKREKFKEKIKHS